MHFLINEYFSRPSWRAPGRASPLAQRPSRPTGASRGLGRSLAAPGEAEGLVWLWDTPNFEAKLIIPVPGAAPVKDARTGPGSSNRAVPANPLPPVPDGEDLGERVALFWLLGWSFDQKFIKRRSARRHEYFRDFAKQPSGCLGGGDAPGRGSPRCRSGSLFEARRVRPPPLRRGHRGHRWPAAPGLGAAPLSAVKRPRL